MSGNDAAIRVLHVYDEPGFADLTAEMLTREDERFDIETVTTASDALDRIAATDYDCVISDYDMPGRNGIEFLEALREDHPNLPYILYTGKGSEEVASDAISAGVTDYLGKGGGTDQYTVLANRLRNAVEKYHAELAQERNRVLVEEATDVILIVDANATIQYATPSAEAILGRTPAELVGSSGFEPIHPDDQEPVMETFATLVEDAGGRRSVEFRYERPDGTYIWVEARGRNLLDTPPIEGLVIYTRDITERKHRRTALQELQARTQALMHTGDQEATAREAVETATHLLDAPLSGVHLATDDRKRLEPIAIGDAVLDTLAAPPTYRRDDPDEPAAFVWTTFEEGNPRIIQDTEDDLGLATTTPARSAIIHPLDDHGVFIVSATEPHAFDATDQAVVEILGTALTAALDRVERESRLREREQRLATERDRMTALYEMVPDPITQVRFEDDEPILIDFNDAFETTFGYDAESAVGQSLNDLLVPPEYEAEADRIDATVRSSGVVVREVRRETVDGIGDFLFRAVPIGDPEETVEYFGIYVDITGQKETERRLARQNERLDAFASIVSHDLRNPLNVASGHLEFAREDRDTEHLSAVATALDRMDALIEDLLGLARDGGDPPDLEPVDLAEVARACWETVATADASLSIASDTTIHADPDRLRRLLENLFRNAVDHAGDDVTVTVGDLSDGFYVEDDGPGIDPGQREQVFETGYTTRANGTGFGLAIVEAIAAAHDWTVGITENAMGGARFEFTEGTVED